MQSDLHAVTAEMADNVTPSRHEKSLGLLTTKFVSLLQEAQDGVLDLKHVIDISLIKLLILGLFQKHESMVFEH